MSNCPVLFVARFSTRYPEKAASIANPKVLQENAPADDIWYTLVIAPVNAASIPPRSKSLIPTLNSLDLGSVLFGIGGFGGFIGMIFRIND